MRKSTLIAAFSYLVPFIAVIFGLYIAGNIWMTMLGYHVLALAMLITGKQGGGVKTLFAGGTPFMAVSAFVAAAASGVILYLSSGLLHIPSNLGSILAGQGLTQANWPIFILYYSFVNPIIEEFYWRGYLGGDTSRITWSDLCYAGYHPLVLLRYIDWPWVIVEFAVLVGVAWVWRMIIRKYQGLLIPVLMHLAADFAIVLAIYVLAVQQF